MLKSKFEATAQKKCCSENVLFFIEISRNDMEMRGVTSHFGARLVARPPAVFWDQQLFHF